MMGGFGFAEVEIRDGFIVSAREADGSEWEADSRSRRSRSPRMLTHLVVILIAAVPVTMAVASARTDRPSNGPRGSISSSIGSPSSPAQATTASVPVATPSVVPAGHPATAYTTQAGDTWMALATKFRLTADELAWSNPDSGANLLPGTVLLVPPVRGVVVTTGAQDSVEGLAKTFQVDPVVLASYNALPVTGAIPAGVQLVIPGAKPSPSATVPDSSALALRCPVGKSTLSQGFGPSSLWFEPSFGNYRNFHKGIDLSGAYGTPVLASTGGTVAAAGFNLGGYGFRVEVLDPLGRRELYAHMERVSVARGDTVNSGDVLGLMGSTGLSTGPHVHFELQVDGQPVDPAPRLHC